MMANLTLRPLIRENLLSVQRETSVLGRVTAKRAATREASRVLTVLTVESLKAEENLGKTQIGLAEAAVKGAMIADGVQTLGALKTDIVIRTGAVHDKLTATAAAGRIAHVMTRAETRQAIEARLQEGMLSADEAAAMNSFADADLVQNIERNNDRIRRAKESVEALHDSALAGFRRATDLIG